MNERLTFELSVTEMMRLTAMGLLRERQLAGNYSVSLSMLLSGSPPNVEQFVFYFTPLPASSDGVSVGAPSPPGQAR